ncbi:SpaH/EbpB family LPXTG-anchored major pilin [Trueperella pyogenes]
MRGKISGVRRTLAVLGAGALSLLVIGGGALPANATNGNIDFTREGSITVHKFQNPTEGTGSINSASGVTGTALEGVEFTVTPVKDINLTTNEGWEKLQGLTADKAQVDTEKAVTITTKNNGSATAQKLAIGVYKVSETKTVDAKANGKPVKVATAAADFLVSIPMSQKGEWVYDVNVFPKNTVLTNDNKPVKTVADDSRTYFPGDTITWQIKQTLPDPGRDAKFSGYKIVDQLPVGVNSVTSDKVTVTKNGDKVDGVVTVSDKNVVTVEFKGKELEALKADDKIVVTISATVSDSAETLSNQAQVTVNDATVNTTTDPNQTEDTPTVTKFVDLTINKVNSKKEPLADATFTITPVDNGGVPVADVAAKEVTTAKDTGKATQRLKTGRYLIMETKAPVGYEIAKDYLEGTVIEVGADGHTVTVENLSVDETGNGLLPNLPLTGAQGAVLLTLLGLAIVAIAVGTGFVSVRRRS